MFYHDFAFPLRTAQWEGEAVVRITRAKWAKQLLPGWSTAVGGPFGVGFSLRTKPVVIAPPDRLASFPGLAGRLKEGRG
jgi:hypothetical protein